MKALTKSASKRKCHHPDLKSWFSVGHLDVTAAAKVSAQETGLSLGNLTASSVHSHSFFCWLRNLNKAKINDDLKQKRARRISELKKN